MPGSLHKTKPPAKHFVSVQKASDHPRQKRVASEVQKALANAVRSADLPNMTVTDVRMSACLRNAKVYVLPFGGGNAETLLKSLQEQGAFLRREVGKTIALRYVPALHFFIDTIFAQSARVEDLLRSLPVPDSSYPSGES